MAKFDSLMLPPKPEPQRVRDLAVGQTRYVGESDLHALDDGTGLLSTRAFVRPRRSFLYAVAVTRTRSGWRVEVPRGFKIHTTRRRRPPDHEEIQEIVTGDEKPEAGPVDYAEGVFALFELIVR